MEKEEAVYRAALQLVDHFEDCMAMDGRGIHSRIFTHILHPEIDFVSVGQSQEVIDGAKPYPEHIVPCAVIVHESCKLIKDGVSRDEIARLIQKHWKIALISKQQADYLDLKKFLNMRDKMPEGWCFKTSDSYERIQVAKIELYPVG